jgi:acyl-coenzyme A synthetase/AMP-(fatty) acid ligase
MELKAGDRIDPEALRVRSKERLDGYEVPKAVIVVDALPRTSTGKIQKNVVRA